MLELIFAATWAVVSTGVSIACLARVLTLPQAPALGKRLSEMELEVETARGMVGSLRSEFHRLEGDVEENLEQASQRNKRAATRESNTKRRGQQVDEQEGPTLQQQFQQAEMQNWDG